MEIMNLTFKGFYQNLNWTRENRADYTYSDLVKHWKLTHYNSEKMEELIPLIWKMKKSWKFVPKFGIEFLEVVDNRLKLFNNHWFNEYHDKMKYTLWDADRFIKNSLFLNFFSQYDIFVLTADDSDETIIATKWKITKDPLQIVYWIFALIFTPFFLLWMWIKKFFSVLFFIDDNKLWSLVLMLVLTWVYCYYSWDIAEALAKQAQMIAEIKKLWLI